MIKLVITTSDKSEKSIKQYLLNQMEKQKRSISGLVVIKIIYNLMTRIKENDIENAMKKI